MVIDKRDIDLTKYRGNKSSVFTGRPQGYDVRKELNLDAEDTSEDVVVFTIPEGTTSFNPSFYLGLLFDSYKKLGLEGFHSKYSFNIQANNPAIKRVLQKNLEDANRSAINSLNRKNPFKYFDE